MSSIVLFSRSGRGLRHLVAVARLPGMPLGEVVSPLVPARDPWPKFRGLGALKRLPCQAPRSRGATHRVCARAHHPTIKTNGTTSRLRRGAAISALAAILVTPLAAPGSARAGYLAASDGDRDAIANAQEQNISGITFAGDATECHRAGDADDLFVRGADPLDASSLPRLFGPTVDPFLYGTPPSASNVAGDGPGDEPELLVDGVNTSVADIDADGVDHGARGLVGTDPLDPIDS